jgi:hypothetical protein
MLFQYIGDGENSPKTTDAFGYVFELNGEPVDVVNEAAIAKLKGNKTFIYNPDGDKQEEIEVSYQEMKSFILSAGVKLISLKKADVKAQYDELQGE